VSTLVQSGSTTIPKLITRQSRLRSRGMRTRGWRAHGRSPRYGPLETLIIGLRIENHTLRLAKLPFLKFPPTRHATFDVVVA
jgi:hypothetical protein